MMNLKKIFNKSKFIVFEGQDGAGKTTLALALKNYLIDKGISVDYTKEPTDSIIGEIIRKHSHLINWKTQSYLCVADRNEHLNPCIEPSIITNSSVICDRYILSNIAYQSEADNDDTRSNYRRTFIEELNEDFFKPDITFVILTDLDTSYQRVCKKYSNDKFENLKMQAHVKRFYDKLASDNFDLCESHNIYFINGNKSEELMLAEVLEGLKTLE